MQERSETERHANTGPAAGLAKADQVCCEIVINESHFVLCYMLSCYLVRNLFKQFFVRYSSTNQRHELLCDKFDIYMSDN